MMIGHFFGWLVLMCIHSMTSENHSKSTKLNPLAHCHIQNLIFTIPVALPPPHPPPKNNREHEIFFVFKKWRQDLCNKTIMGKISHLLFGALVKINNSFVEPWTWMMHAIIKSYQLLTGFSHLPFHLLGCFSSSRSAFVKNTDKLTDKIIGLMMIDHKIGWLVLICIHSMSSVLNSVPWQY